MAKPGKGPRLVTESDVDALLDPAPAEVPASIRRPPPRRPPGNGDGHDGDPEPAPAVETFTAEELLRMELPEPRFAVEGIVPEGLSVLAGKPKLGKSWAALNLALAVATGGVALGKVQVEQGAVLYLALEDTKRRLKGRLGKLLGRQHAEAPAALTLAREWPRQDKGGLLALAEWLDAHPDARLVVIDTWVRFRPSRVRGANEYEEDTRHAAELQALAHRYKVAVLIITHCRKMPSADPLEEVMGSQGTTGSADGILVLRRERGRHDAALFIDGRDVVQQELALTWDPPCCLWTIAGAAEEFRRSKEREAVICLLRQEGPLSPARAAPLLGKKDAATRKLLWTMAQDGQLRALGDGRYELLGNNGNSSNGGHGTDGADRGVTADEKPGNAAGNAEDGMQTPWD
jgi:hypothetical protein